MVANLRNYSIHLNCFINTICSLVGFDKDQLVISWIKNYCTSQAFQILTPELYVSTFLTQYSEEH